MKPITKVLKDLSPEEYYQKHLHIVQQFLPAQLTNKEVEVLALFMSLSGDVAEMDRFGTQCRKIVMKKLGLKPGGLSNYLRAFEEKGFIKKVDKSFEITRFLFPDPKVQGYQFLIQKK